MKTNLILLLGFSIVSLVVVVVTPILWLSVNIVQGTLRYEFASPAQWGPPITSIVASLALLAAARSERLAPATVVRATPPATGIDSPAMRSRRRSAMARAPSRSVSGRRMQNSSPPKRPTVSDTRAGGGVGRSEPVDARPGSYDLVPLDLMRKTIRANPGEVTRLIATFDLAGNYVWHCHILEHEDNEMMRPLVVMPK